MTDETEKEPIYDEEVIADIEIFNKRIHDALDKTQDGKGETLRVCFDIPVEFLSLATWLELRGRDMRLTTNGQKETGSYKALGKRISMPPIHAHKAHAKNYIYHLLWDHFQMEIHELCQYIHPYLLKPEPRPESAEKAHKNKDDNLPF